MAEDIGPRADTTLEKMAGLKPLQEGGRVTAAVSSQLTDGAAALLVVSEQALKDHGLTPRARIHHLSVRGDDPVMMLTAPIPATAHALTKTGLSIDDIDLVEINEAFASVVLAWQKETGADLARVNVNGGGIALGHPLGATGRTADDDAAARARADRRPLRPADDVRGRRAGERHHHRAPLARSACGERWWSHAPSCVRRSRGCHNTAYVELREDPKRVRMRVIREVFRSPTPCGMDVVARVPVSAPIGDRQILHDKVDGAQMPPQTHYLSPFVP